MFFKDYLNSVANCLEAKLQGFQQQKHSGEIGELCEFFIRLRRNSGRQNRLITGFVEKRFSLKKVMEKRITSSQVRNLL